MINCEHANSWLVCDLRLDKDLPDCLCILLEESECKEQETEKEAIHRIMHNPELEKYKKFKITLKITDIKQDCSDMEKEIGKLFPEKESE